MQDLVVGDVVHLSAGDMVPADLRLISSRDLFVSQAILTGEPLPIDKYDTLGALAEKSAEASGSGSDTPLDTANACFMGTNIVSGQATALVIATGTRTYFGSLARAVVGRHPQTAFDRSVNNVS